MSGERVNRGQPRCGIGERVGPVRVEEPRREVDQLRQRDRTDQAALVVEHVVEAIDRDDNAYVVLDLLRMEIVPVGRRFQVRAYVNGVDLTGAAAGLGMDPFEVLVPVNRYARPGTVPFARCPACGVYDCVGTDVTVRRDGGVVTWSWSGRDLPLDHDVRFAADAYHAEVMRAAADRSWETPERTACRLVLTGVPSLPEGVTVDGGMIGVTSATPDLFDVTLSIGEEYQVFLSFPWDGDPDRLAREALGTLARPAAEWPAQWHGVPPEARERPPAIAGAAWRRVTWG